MLVNRFGIRAARHPSERMNRARGYFLADVAPAMSSFGIRLPGPEGGGEKPDGLDKPSELDGKPANPSGSSVSSDTSGSPTPPKQPANNIHYGILDYDDLENFPERENTP